jgi:hypothetical protein
LRASARAGDRPGRIELINLPSTLPTCEFEGRIPSRTYFYIIGERKGQGAKPKTVKTASPPFHAPHRRPRRPFPPRQGEKTALARFLGEKYQRQFYARSMFAKITGVNFCKSSRSCTPQRHVSSGGLFACGGANQPAGTKGEVMPWSPGKTQRFCFSS